MIDEYDEITNVLEKISRRLNNDNIFVSGSAAEYGDYEEKEAMEFIHQLSNRLIREEYNIISGFGVGVGSAVITGALKEIYMRRKTINESRLLLRPFPQGIENEDTRQKLWKQYREDMISRAGISIFLFGNKLENGNIVLANGMRSEFQIAKEQHNLIVPIGCTGYVAQEIWEEVNKDLAKYYNKVDADLKETFEKLNSKVDNNTLIDNVLKFIKLIRR